MYDSRSFLSPSALFGLGGTAAAAAAGGGGAGGLLDPERRKRNRTFIDPVSEVPKLEEWFSHNTHPSHALISRWGVQKKTRLFSLYPSINFVFISVQVHGGAEPPPLPAEVSAAGAEEHPVLVQEQEGKVQEDERGDRLCFGRWRSSPSSIQRRSSFQQQQRRRASQPNMHLKLFRTVDHIPQVMHWK